MTAAKKHISHNKICNSHQYAGIETSVMDNGPAKGLRAAWVNTGSGLRYKVLIDRALDIAEAFYNQYALAWLSHGGWQGPRPDANSGLEWLYAWAGGLVTTCGLTHIGGPEEDRGLHGRISNCPAELESIVQPDPAAGRLDMSITAVTKQSRMFGPNLELRRTISSRAGSTMIKISDTVCNKGSEAVPHMLLYHCNFGWPLIDQGARILWKGKIKSRGLEMDDAIFNDKRDYTKCPGPMESHRGGGEACGFIDVAADRSGKCSVGVYNPKIKLALALRYKKSQLPHLANWQHWGMGDYVMGLEPGTNPPIGQNLARERKKLIYLKPGQAKKYEMQMDILTAKKDIDEFVKVSTK